MKNSSLAIARAPSVSPCSGNSSTRSTSEEKFSSRAAELAHADDDQGLQRAGGRAGLPVARHERSARVRERAADGRIGAVGELLERFRHRGPAGQVAPGDAHELIAAPAPQLRHERRFAPGGVGRKRRTRGVIRARQPPPEVAAAHELPEQLRIAGAGVGDEVAGGNDAGQRVAHRRRGGGERVVIGRVCEQRLKGARKKAGELGTDPRGRGQFQMLPPRS